MDTKDEQEFIKQAERLLKNSDTDIHFADDTKFGMSTLCGKPIPPAKTSPYTEDVTCKACIGESNWRAL